MVILRSSLFSSLLSRLYTLYSRIASSESVKPPFICLSRRTLNRRCADHVSCNVWTETCPGSTIPASSLYNEFVSRKNLWEAVSFVSQTFNFQPEISRNEGEEGRALNLISIKTLAHSTTICHMKERRYKEAREMSCESK